MLPQRPVCLMLVTGAPLAARTAELVKEIMAAGWDVSVTASESSLAWFDSVLVETVCGYPVRAVHRQRDSSAPRWPPAAVVVCPATFNTLSKAATGIADTLVASVLCESIGARIPVFAVPMLKKTLWTHPAFLSHLNLLGHAGVQFIDVSTGHTRPEPIDSGMGQSVTAAFKPSWIIAALSSLKPTSERP